jgi:1-acyl-sn-glycerol-3-phosphate acyltransferase
MMNATQFLDDDLDPSDLGNRDPAFIRDVALPLVAFVRRYYFRSEIEGTDRIPTAGSFIAVANHNGGPILADTWVMLSYWWSLFGVERGGYALVHDAPVRIPMLKSVLLRLGALRASAENATTVIRAGAPLLIYPGGELDCLKSFWRRHTIDFHGRTGFVRLALTHGVPIVPIVNVGGHEVFLTLFSSRRLAEWTGLARLTRVKTVPMNLGLPWGLWATGFVPFLPLPAKLQYRVGEPIDLGHDPEAAADRRVVQRAYARVTRTMQRMLDDLASRRRLPVFG